MNADDGGIADALEPSRAMATSSLVPDPNSASGFKVANTFGEEGKSMTVKELVEALSKYPSDTPVQAWDFDEGSYEAVTGLDWEIDGGWIFILTGDPQ